MKDDDLLVFKQLLNDAYKKCFGHTINGPVTETESKIFCNRVLDQTGLSIGWKSIKNYSLYIAAANVAKTENPSTATLDTLARYVLGAPYTSEIRRKNDESHYPYWFIYKQKFSGVSKTNRSRVRIVTILLSLAAAIVCSTVYFESGVFASASDFTDYFNHVDEHTLFNNGWFVKSKERLFWNKRDRKPGQLTLYTLKGDTWPDSASKPDVKNLLLRRISSDCFTTEVHFSRFVPREEWQQAGIILLEDTAFKGKSIRLSLGFNDNFGGRKMPKEIYVQAITSLGSGFGKPEEVAHKPVLYLDSAVSNPALFDNLNNTALRIEKRGDRYRFLYAGGSLQNGAFKEVETHEFDMKPRYIGLFALRGFTSSSDVPVNFKFFRITTEPCKP